MLLSDFHIIRPPFETSQEKGLEWFVQAHIQSEKMKGTSLSELDDFSQKIRERIERLCCKPHQIGKRGHVLKDFLHHNWDLMELYRLNESPMGKGLKERIDFYKKEVERIFEEYYSQEIEAPDDLIHVTCTGYISPSGAQKLVSNKNWGDQTTVTHAYHMGCYGSLPALRMGLGFLGSSDKKRCDIVHTEICSIHSNVSKHEADQLITQSLFADGFAKYSMVKKADGAHLKVLNVMEELIPNSAKAMTWDLSDWNFTMTLAKEVPVLISRALPSFLKKLMKNITPEEAFFAIHPGGPKIVAQVQELLGLKDSQISHSLQILNSCGNMSSATLPHIWNEMILDKNIPENAPIVSLAFGPGLCIAGAMMEKRCGS